MWSGVSAACGAVCCCGNTCPSRPGGRGGHGAGVRVEGVTCLEWCRARSTRPRGLGCRRPAGQSVQCPCVMCSLRSLTGWPRPAPPTRASSEFALVLPSPRSDCGLSTKGQQPTRPSRRDAQLRAPSALQKGRHALPSPGRTESHAASGQRAAPLPRRGAEAALVTAPRYSTTAPPRDWASGGAVLPLKALLP